VPDEVKTNKKRPLPDESIVSKGIQRRKQETKELTEIE